VRRIPRKTLAAAGTVVVALGLSGVAWADGAADQTSQVAGSVNPGLQSASKAGKGSLFTQVTTYDNDNSPVIPAQPAEVVRIDFPAEMTYTSNKYLDQCDPTDTEISTGTTDEAVAHCSKALIGSGNAIARVPGFPTANNEAKLTVSAFNGLTSVAGEQNSTDVPTGGFVGGNPTVVLQAAVPALPSTVVLGEIRPSPNGALYGSQLNVTDATDVAGDAGALVLFNSQIQKAYTNGKKGNKEKKYNLISATCDDSGGDGKYDFQGTWTYDDASVDSAIINQNCTTK
jgi:hypothetical protein